LTIINNEIFNSITEEYNYKLELLVMSSEDIFKNLESGNIDLAVIDNSYNDDLFEGTLIDTYNIVPFVHTEGKFKEIKRITREMLKNNPIIMSNDNEGMTISVKESLKKSNININPDNLYFSNSPYLMTKMIKQFDGIAFMYGNYVDSLPGIKKMELTNFKSSQNVYLIYSISSFEKTNFKKICNKVKKA
jgi:DNA-binding transcriptional LysR family regulator